MFCEAIDLVNEWIRMISETLKPCLCLIISFFVLAIRAINNIFFSFSFYMQKNVYFKKISHIFLELMPAQHPVSYPVGQNEADT